MCHFLAKLLGEDCLFFNVIIYFCDGNQSIQTIERMTKTYVLMLVVWLSLTSMTTLNACSSRVNPAAKGTPTASEQQPAVAAQTSGEVVLGAARTDAYVPLLKGKRVALLSNQTGMVGDKHTLDLMLENGVNVVTIFSPEHGFRGNADAGEHVSSSVDEKTGIPIASLYDGKSPMPSKQVMDGLDVIVTDIQDVGLRFYTYYVTMINLMDAAVTYGKQFVVLDRPNPNGMYVDGPILDMTLKSGVGRLPIPTVHGMTLGELAQMINGEGWLKAGADACDLKVIPCRNYTHQVKISLIRSPSPNLKDMRAVYLYSSTCFFENTAVSVGRGTDFPFEVYGSPYLSGTDFEPADGGIAFTFVPQSMTGAHNPPFEGMECAGADLREIPIEKIWSAGIDLSYLIEAYHAVQQTTPPQQTTSEVFFSSEVSFWGKPDGNHYWIDMLSGSDELRTMIEEGKTAEEIKASWQEELEAFREQRKPYLLYEE